MKKILLIVVAAILAVGATALATDFITGYDVNNNYAPVQVEKGVYAPGISLTNDAVLGASLPREINISTSTLASATSSAISLKGVSKATLFMSTIIPTPASSTSTFSVVVSGDDANYTAFNKLIDNVTNTNAQTLTRVASKAYTATTTSAIVSLDLSDDVFTSMKVVITQATTTGGVLSGAIAKVLLEY